jgi:hypothetical protein
MLPRATALDDRPLAPLRRGAGRVAAYGRAHAAGLFLVGHCAIAGAVQLTALVGDLARADRHLPDAATLAWAWLGLGLIAIIPALVTAALMLAPWRRITRLGIALGVGAAFYLLPILAMVGTFEPIATFVPVATLWHAALAFLPCAPPARR